MKKRAVSITVTRAEGPSAECGIGHVLEGEGIWARATSILSRWGNSGPPDMLGCFKCDVEITFEDGFTYDARYEAKPDGLSLERHVRNNCEFYSGRDPHPWMGEKRYRSLLKDLVKPEAAALYGKILDEYLLQDPPRASAQAEWLEAMGA